MTRLARVRFLVLFKIRDARKVLSAERTDVRLHARMRLHVLLQVIGGNEGFTALFTLKRFHGGMTEKMLS